ncbi:MAG: response regulator [Chitinophagaceae bacterium]|nr:MAG: response regulator [Chitinophagaceae bacterium]
MAKRILIIDDDRDMLEMLKIVFQSSDIDVVLSETGMTGDQIRVTHPDLVLLDVMIKGYITTGDEICREIKGNKDLAHIPVFLISSERDLDLLAVKCQADGFFAKPFDILKLKTIIKDKLL